MSEPKIISPLLDGFTLGAPISDHDGVLCCPAVKENSEEKYIVKIISIPASQVQMDALLLAGAYKDPADAMTYYLHIGEDLLKEADLLKDLSKLDGFLAYDGCQMEPITRKRLGYQVYLVGSYKHSLAKYVRKNPVTHLEAIHLGLDICSALTVCRQAGYLYVDLKPNNIFVSDQKEYRIGDLGFLPLDALHYSTLPDKYRSAYTPPEALDPMTALSPTIDTYALGMILYQLYNDGQLPQKGNSLEEPIPSPINADYELAEIIVRAIDPEPAKRWQEPSDFGKALASYMQRNSVTETPITPHTPLDVTDEDMVSVPENSNSSYEDTQAQATPAPEQDAGSPEDIPAQEDTASPEAASAQVPDETAPAEEDAETLLPHEMSEELSRMVAKADDLIAHETPEGVVIPEAPELPDPFAFAAEDSEAEDDSDVPLDPVMEDPEEQKQKKKKAKKTYASQKWKRALRKVLSFIAAVLVLVVIGMAGFAYYRFFYIQTIHDILIEGDETHLTVSVNSKTDPALLRVICSDNYGNARKESLMDGKATFDDLIPNTMYTITLEIDGFHKLAGQTSDIFTTDATTNIVSFNAVTGSQDGTVMLSFTVDGTEPEEWMLRYHAEGEEEEFELFSGHTVTIDELTVGKLYTFTLDAGKELSLSGASTLQFLASRLILAEDLTVTSTGNSDMTVHWKAPGDIFVESWDIRCYSEEGYDETLTVHDTSVLLTGIDPTVSYTVEVTASGMTQPARASITANPINVLSLNVEESNDKQLNVSWDFEGAAPVEGWLLIYSMDGGNTQNVVKTKTASAVISPKIPGAKYLFTIQSQDGTSIFNNVQTYTCPEAPSFEGYSLSAEYVEAMLVKTPDDAYWHFGKLGSDAVTDTFALGEKISVVLHSEKDFYLPGSQKIELLYVIRDAYGNVIPDLIGQETGYWKDIWFTGDYHYAELNLPNLPDTVGEYTLNLYFNGMEMAEVTFTIQ